MPTVVPKLLFLLFFLSILVSQDMKRRLVDQEMSASALSSGKDKNP